MKLSRSLARAWWIAFALTLLIAAVALAAPITGTFTGLGPYSTITGTFNGQPASYSGGTMKLSVNGTTVGAFCTDLEHHISSGDTLVSTEAEMDCRITWMLINYPPLLSTDPYTPTGQMLSNRSQEMAARQAVVWHFADGFLPTTSITDTVGVRAWQIIDSVPADACATLEADVPTLSVQPTASVRTVGDDVETFTVTALKGDTPISGLTLYGSTDFGTLGSAIATTDANGQASFTLTNSSSLTGTANFVVSATVNLPVGTIFEGSPSAEKQKLVLGQLTPGSIYRSGSVTWQAPGSAVAHVFHDRNLDGAQTGAEDNLSGWSVTLYQWNGSAWTSLSTKTTSASGVASFTGLAAGLYRVDETVQSGWRTTTASSVEVTVGLTAATVDFGVVRAPVVVAMKFNDLDADGVREADEPYLPDWTMTLYRADGSAVLGATGETNAEGKVVLTFDRASDFDAGAYFVQETAQLPWFVTTGGLTQSVTLSGNDFITVTFGNALAQPALSLTKTAPAAAHVGDSISLDYTVENTGNVALSGVSVSDPLAGGAIADCNRGSLAVGASYTCSVTISVPDGSDPLSSTAAAGGADAFGQSAGDTDSASTDVLHPSISVTVSAPANADSGTTVHYSLTVENTGDADLGSVIVTDSLTGFSWSGSLAAGASQTLSADYATDWAQSGMLTNDVSASAQDELGQSVSDGDSASTLLTIPDSDGDGINDPTEGNGDADNDGTPNYLDTDSDGDGQGDAVEGTGDADGDGTPNYLDADDDDGPNGDLDGDGITNSDENNVDADGDGSANPDADNDGTPNREDSDSDNDGQSDADEGTGDADGDGIANYVDADDNDGPSGDLDGDGTPNGSDTDNDNDGIVDASEGGGDADGDGVPNYLDTDSDGDTIPDSLEGTGDADGDGLPNYLDADSDGDTIPDSLEGAGDADGDGLPNYLDADSDGDTIPDSIEGAGDADHDGTPNYLDVDSDGDAISDLIEWTVDANHDGLADHDIDGDGTPNYLDADSDGDGVPDVLEGGGDKDGDGVPNFADTDSDNDGISDGLECSPLQRECHDADGDGTPNYLDSDSDNDGINDAGEYSTGPSDKLTGCTANSPVCTNNDVDGDGKPNYRDSDSDGDGISDNLEGTGDADQDGIPDYLDNVNSTPTQYKVFIPFVSRNH